MILVKGIIEDLLHLVHVILDSMMTLLKLTVNLVLQGVLLVL